MVEVDARIQSRLVDLHFLIAQEEYVILTRLQY